ncbi:phage portal protein [Ignavigranum ruoffiae]|uniref:phage portal protein n=2 Tax=Ignavigranum ruoffiae TaxID=89093 RepID=UPI00206A1FB4
MDYSNPERRVDSLQFDEDANIHFVYSNMQDLLNTEQGKKSLTDMLSVFFNAQKIRLDILDGYSKGHNYTILSGRRRLEQEKSDYRVTHNWGGYISNYITGYLISKPITIGTRQADDDETQSLATIHDINLDNDIDTLNFELGFDASRFGRAFELHYRDLGGTDNIVQIDPREIFVIRSTDVSKRVIGAVHVPIYNGEINMTIYTNTHAIQFQPFKEGAVTFSELSRRKHMYDDVPVVEWWNNRFRQGDFENEIPLIDAYDAAQSDTANYMSDLNDALLVINGDLDSAGITPTDAMLMKKANMLLLESGIDHTGKQTSVGAEYIYKQYDVQGVEAYKTRLINDIYKLSKVPNLDDDRFNASNSGIALKYKMIGLEQIKSIKESFFSKALRRRYQLIENIHNGLSTNKITADDLTFTFHENIPEDIWQEVERYINVGGVVSDTTLMELASFIPNADEEKQRIALDGVRPDATDSVKAVIEDE